MSPMNQTQIIKLYTCSLVKYWNSKIKSCQMCIERDKEELKRLKKRKTKPATVKERIRVLKARIERDTKELKEARRNRRKLEKKLEKTLLRSDITALKKHPQIVGVDFDKKKGNLMIYTYPLRVKLQKSYEIGNFEIEISLSDVNFSSIRIGNLDRKAYSGYDHWAVSGGRPCWGNWGKGIREHYETGHLYFLVDTILRFLTTLKSRDAWISHDSWLRNARLLKPPKEKSKFKIGDKVKAISAKGEGWGRVKKGDIGIVTNGERKNLRVDFPLQNNWLAMPSDLRKVTK